MLRTLRQALNAGIQLQRRHNKTLNLTRCCRAETSELTSACERIAAQQMPNRPGGEWLSPVELARREWILLDRQQS
jgi:hypothetical protein